MAHLIPYSPPGLVPAQDAPPPLRVAEIALSDFVAMLRRQWVAIVLCLGVSVLLIGVYTYRSQPVYEATSLVRFEQELVNLPQLVQQVTTENRISTEIELLQSRGAAEAVIDSLGLRAQLVLPAKGRVTEFFPVLKVAASADTATVLVRRAGQRGFWVYREGADSQAVPVQYGDLVTVAGLTLTLSRVSAAPELLKLRVISLDDAVRAFAASLKVSRPARDADLIAVRTTSSDPVLAARASNLLAEHLISKRQIELERRTGTTVDFLRFQLDTLRQQLTVAEDTLRIYQERTGSIDPAEQARTEVGRLSQLQADRGGLEAERQALSALMSQISLQAVASPDGPSPYRRLIAFPTLLRNQAAAELLNSLGMVENERSALLRRRSYLDPDVQMLTTRVEELDTQLKTIAETYLQGLTNQVAGLDDVGRQFSRELSMLPRKEVTTARLTRQARVLQDMYALIQTRLKESEITQAMQDPTVRIADRAVAADRPIRPRPALNLALSLVLGSLLAVSVALGREMADRSVRSRSDALQVSGLPVLGTLPEVEAILPRSFGRLPGRRGRAVISRNGNGRNGNGNGNGKNGGNPGLSDSRTVAQLQARLITRMDVSRTYAESFNQLHANLALAYRDRPLKVLVFTSPLPGEGKTLSAINFALTAAAKGIQVLLIDADLRCGVISDVFKIARRPGFNELLSGKARFEEGARAIPIGDGGTLVVLPSGELIHGPTRALAMDRLRTTLASLATRYDLVVIDTPPINLLADAALIGSAADGVLVVVRAGQTQGDALRFAMGQLTAARAPLLGTVLNDIDTSQDAYDDGAFKYLAESQRYHGERA